MLAVPSAAYARASYGIIWGPQVVEAATGEKGVVVIAGNAFSAAAYALGKNPNNHQVFTDVVKSKLSNAETGGRFYEFVQAFQSVGQDGENYPTWATSMNMGGAFYTWAYSYGGSQVWWAAYADAFRASALEDLETVLAGGSLGGGGGSGSSDGYYYFDVPIAIGGNFVSTAGMLNFRVGTYFTNKYAATNGDGATSGSRLLLDDVVTIRVPTSSFPVDLDDGYVGFVKFNTSGSSCHVMLGYAASSDVTFGTSAYTASFYDGTSATYNLLTCSGNARLSAWVGTPVYEGDSTFRFDNAPSWNNSQGAFDWSGVYSDGVPTDCYIGRRAVAGPPLPPDWPNNWPDDGGGGTGGTPDVPEPTQDPVTDPVEPVGGTPPELPNPTEYTVPTEEPNVPYTGVIVTEPTNTSPADYTPWLRAILQAINAMHASLVSIGNAINDSLDEHCDHITSTIHGESVYLMGGIRSAISGAVASVNARLRDESHWLEGSLEYDMWQVTYHLENYLDELFEWLAGVMDDNAFDASAILRWLSDIDAHIRDLEVNGGPVTEGDFNVSINLDHLADFDFDKLVDYWSDFDGTFDVALDFDLHSDLTSVISHLQTIERDLDTLIDQTQPRTIDFTAFFNHFRAIEDRLDGVIAAIEGLDFTSLEPIDWSQQWGYVIEDLDVITADMADIEQLLAEISAKLDGLGRGNRYHEWRAPEPYLDPTTNVWMVPYGTREIEPYGQIEVVYRPMAEVFNTDALERAFRELCNHFPFSMLNKLVQVAAWLVRPGVPPRFDLPVPNVDDWASPLTVTVDLRGFDPVAAVARMGVLLWAIVRVSSRTIDMWVKE